MLGVTQNDSTAKIKDVLSLAIHEKPHSFDVKSAKIYDAEALDRPVYSDVSRLLKIESFLVLDFV